MGVAAGPRPAWLLGRGRACPQQHVSCRRHGAPAWARVQLCASPPRPVGLAHPVHPPGPSFLPRGAFEAPGKLDGSADTALRGFSVGLGSEGVGGAAQAASPYLPPTSELVLPQEVRRRGARPAPPPPARAEQSFPRRGPASRPHIHRGAAHSGAGALPRVDALAAGRGQAGPPRRFLPRGHPAPLRCSERLRVCGGGAWARGGGRHTALGPAHVLAQGTGTCGGACSPLQPPGCSQTLFSAGPRAKGPPRVPPAPPPVPSSATSLPPGLHPGFSDAATGQGLTP